MKRYNAAKVRRQKIIREKLDAPPPSDQPTTASDGPPPTFAGTATPPAEKVLTIGPLAILGWAFHGKDYVYDETPAPTTPEATSQATPKDTETPFGIDPEVWEVYRQERRHERIHPKIRARGEVSYTTKNPIEDSDSID